MIFDVFKWGPAADLLQRAFGFDVTQCVSWQDYSQALRGHCVDQEHYTKFLARVRCWYGRFSSGEKVLFLACLQAADYGRLADEITGGRFMELVRSTRLSEDFALAFGAAMARIDKMELLVD
jgi:hypothetical protein